MPNFRERPTPVRRLLVYVAVLLIGVAVGELFGGHWRSNFIVPAVLAFEAAWLVPQLRADRSIRLKPLREWINSSNLFEWLALAGWIAFYVGAVAASVREGETRLFPTLLLLLVVFSAMGLSEHVLRTRPKPPPSPPLPG